MNNPLIAEKLSKDYSEDIFNQQKKYLTEKQYRIQSEKKAILREKERIEKILGRRICNEAFYTYCTREDYEREQGISM